MKEKESVQPRPQIELEKTEGEAPDSAQLKFKQPTPAPFLLHFSLPNEDEEDGGEVEDLEAKHLHEQERHGCVGAWEEDGTLWRSHEPPPSQGHIAGIPQIHAGEEEEEKEMLVPSSSLLPPHLPPSPVISPPSSPTFQSIHHPEDSFVQSQIRRQQEEALAKEEEKEAEEEVEEESRVVEPLMRLVEAIFSLPTVRPRSHQQLGRQGRKKSVDEVKKERGESEAKLPSSEENQRGGGEEIKSVDGQNRGAEQRRLPGKLLTDCHHNSHLDPVPGPCQGPGSGSRRE